jgi:hypothetical protein
MTSWKQGASDALSIEEIATISYELAVEMEKARSKLLDKREGSQPQSSSKSY